MTTPDVPLRAIVEYEVPGTTEQIWDAIATAEGIGSWFMRTDLDGRVGGAIVTHMGEELSSPGTVTGWNPPHRFAYEEPDWAELSGHPGAVTTPLVTEFLIEAKSGGSCVVRIRVQRDRRLLLRVSSPVQGFLQFGAVDQGDGSTWTQLEGYLFSANAPDYVAQEEAGWKEWLESLAVPA